MGKNRFIVCWILLLLSFTSLSLMPFLVHMTIAGASDGTVVEVEPQASSASVGGNFTVNVTVVDVENLYGIEVDLSWNASILEPVGIDVRLGWADGALYSPLYMAENSTQEGEYTLAAASTSATSFNGTGNLVIVTFEVKSSGTSNLTLATQLYDYPPPDRDPRLSMPIDHSTISGVFSSIIPEIPNPAVLLVFMTFTVVAVAFSRRIQDKNRTRQDLLAEQKATRYAGQRR
jgi:hypothetical protein